MQVWVPWSTADIIIEFTIRHATIYNDALPSIHYKGNFIHSSNIAIYGKAMVHVATVKLS